MASRSGRKPLNRRALLKAGAAAAGLAVGAAALEACAPAPAPTATTAPKPTVAPAQPTAAAAQPTVAPAQPTAAAAQQAPTQVKSGGQMTMAIAQKTSFSHFMHLRHFSGSEYTYLKEFTTAKLTNRSNDRKSWVPALAEKWSFSGDGKQITFNLRRGLKWHDGQPFTSKDVDFTFHMIGMPGLGGASQLTGLQPYVVGVKEFMDGKADRIDGIKATDDYTVTLQLFKPFNADVLFSLLNAIYMAPHHVLSSYLSRDKAKDILQSDWATKAKSYVGIGPFKVVEYEPDQHIIYEPFDGFFKGKPQLSRLIYRPFADAQTLTASLEKKELDVGRIALVEYNRLSKADWLNFVTAKPPTYNGTPFNARQPHLNKKVRQALLHALDRDAINKTLNAGLGEVPHSNIEVPRFGDSPSMKKYPYDPEKAKQLLKEGNWDPNRKIRWAVGAIPSDESYFAAINGYWAKIGVQAEYQVFGQNATVLWGPNWDFDFYPSGYPIGHPVEIAIHFDNRLAQYVSSGFSTPRWEQLLDEVVLQKPEEELKKLVHEMQDIATEEALTLMTFRAYDVWGISKRVKNFNPMYQGYAFATFDWEMEKVTVD